MAKEDFNILELVNNSGCFDLQFRKDARKERTGSPTYYRWKTQFIITTPLSAAPQLQKVAKELGCGAVTKNTNQARFSVQKIDDIAESVVPYFTKNKLSGNKKKDFQLWEKAVGIIAKNKGKAMLAWEKSDLLNLIEIQKQSQQYKASTRPPKWLNMVQKFIKK